jgi:hypothetical protein
LTRSVLSANCSTKINAGQKPKPPDVTQPDGYRAAFEEMPNDTWKTM